MKNAEFLTIYVQKNIFGGEKGGKTPDKTPAPKNKKRDKKHLHE